MWEESRAPLWEQPVEVFDAMFTRGVRAHYVALAVCAPVLISTPASLVVTVSNAVAADGDGAVLDDAVPPVFGDDVARAPDPIGWFGRERSGNQKKAK